MLKELQALDDQVSKPVSLAPPESEVLRILRKGRERINVGWIAGVLARDANGASCDSNAAWATRWCALGAIGWSYFNGASGARNEATEALYRAIPAGWTPSGGVTWPSASMVAQYNNSMGREKTLELFDRAIAAAESPVLP